MANRFSQCAIEPQGHSRPRLISADRIPYCLKVIAELRQE
jgi:hypothetical protein